MCEITVIKKVTKYLDEIMGNRASRICPACDVTNSGAPFTEAMRSLDSRKDKIQEDLTDGFTTPNRFSADPENHTAFSKLEDFPSLPPPLPGHLSEGSLLNSGEYFSDRECLSDRDALMNKAYSLLGVLGERKAAIRQAKSSSS